MSELSILEALEQVAEASRDYTDEHGGGGGGSTLDLTKISVFILDVLNDEVSCSSGGIDQLKRRITT